MTSFDITLKSRVIMHMITSTARRPNASTRSEPVECLSAKTSTRSLALERSSSRVECLLNDDGEVQSGSFAFAGEHAVDHPVPFR